MSPQTGQSRKALTLNPEYMLRTFPPAKILASESVSFSLKDMWSIFLNNNPKYRAYRQVKLPAYKLLEVLAVTDGICYARFARYLIVVGAL